MNGDNLFESLKNGHLIIESAKQSTKQSTKQGSTGNNTALSFAAGAV